MVRRDTITGRPGTARRPWSRKFADAFRGLARAVLGQSSFAVHLAAAVAAVMLAAWLRISAVEWGLVAAAIGGVFAAEIFNTAIESLARGPGSRRHPRLRDALDMASAGVLVAALAAAAIGVAVFGTRVLALLEPIRPRARSTAATAFDGFSEDRVASRRAPCGDPPVFERATRGES